MLGTALAREGQWLDALAAFERSTRLRAHPVTTYNLAYCERALGRYTRAQQLFERALSEHAKTLGGVLTDELFAQTKSYLAEIERRVARAMVSVSAGATLTVDGHRIEKAGTSSPKAVYIAAISESATAAPSGVFELLLDPGRHIFVVARPGSPDKVVTETFQPGERRRLELSLGDASALPAPAPAASSPAGRDYTWPIVAYGVGAAGLALGSIFGIATFNKEADLDELCPDKVCPPEHQSDKDTADRYAMISNIGFGVGIAGVGVGTFLLLSSGGREGEKPAPKAAAKVSVRGWVLPTSVGLRGTF